MKPIYYGTITIRCIPSWFMCERKHYCIELKLFRRHFLRLAAIRENEIATSISSCRCSSWSIGCGEMPLHIMRYMQWVLQVCIMMHRLRRNATSYNAVCAIRLAQVCIMTHRVRPNTTSYNAVYAYDIVVEWTVMWRIEGVAAKHASWKISNKI